MPPPVAPDLRRAELRDLLVLPAQARLRPGGAADPVPPLESELRRRLIYYVDGNFSSRKGIEVGSVTLHPSGIPHGPQPGLAEKSIGLTETHELAVMCDTFHPLRLTSLARDLDDGKYHVLVVRGAFGRRRGSRGRHVALVSVLRALYGAPTVR